MSGQLVKKIKDVNKNYNFFYVRDKVLQTNT